MTGPLSRAPPRPVLLMKGDTEWERLKPFQGERVATPVNGPGAPLIGTALDPKLLDDVRKVRDFLDRDPLARTPAGADPLPPSLRALLTRPPAAPAPSATAPPAATVARAATAPLATTMDQVAGLLPHPIVTERQLQVLDGVARDLRAVRRAIPHLMMLPRQAFEQVADGLMGPLQNLERGVGEARRNLLEGIVFRDAEAVRARFDRPVPRFERIDLAQLKSVGEPPSFAGGDRVQVGDLVVVDQGGKGTLAVVIDVTEHGLRVEVEDKAADFGFQLATISHEDLQRLNPFRMGDSFVVDGVEHYVRGLGQDGKLAVASVEGDRMISRGGTFAEDLARRASGR